MALAGIPMGQQYEVPWTTIHVPAELQGLVFPFAESAIASLDPVRMNIGTRNFLQLLIQLRPFLWHVSTQISVISDCNASLT